MKANVKVTKARKPRSNGEKIETSSGNVFADLGFQDAEERLLKAKLATKIAQLIEKKGWTQAQTAERTALDQPKVSRLLRGQLSGLRIRSWKRGAEQLRLKSHGHVRFGFAV